MKKTFSGVGIALTLILAMLLSGTNAYAGSQDHLVLFDDANYHVTYTGDFPMTRTTIDDCDTSGYQFAINWPNRNHGSSMLGYFPTAKHCNYMGVRSFSFNQWYWRCTYWGVGSTNTYGFPYFGYDPGGWYNDNVDRIAVKYNPNCPLWVP